jgi:hypothetical protein
MDRVILKLRSICEFQAKQMFEGGAPRCEESQDGVLEFLTDDDQQQSPPYNASKECGAG